MMTVRSHFFGTLLSLSCILLFHLGCFFFFSGDSAEEQLLQHKRRRRISPSSPAVPPPSSSISKPQIKSSSLRSYLRRVLSFCKQQQHHLAGPRHGQLISSSSDGGADAVRQFNNVDKKAVVSAEHRSFSSRIEIYPCSACSEVLSKPQLLDLHYAAKHSLSELSHADSGYNIVRIIFESGWKGASPPVVHRILKIHNTGPTLSRFEEYRGAVRSRAAARKGGDERCIADGNERLRFFCTTSLCSGALARGGGACGSRYCTSCAISRNGFPGKHAGGDGIATNATSWGAHAAVPEEMRSEFAFLGARRAMLMCRVVAGRVAEGHGGSGAEEGEEEEEVVGLFDSVAPMGRRGGEDELLVFSTRAVLPCFVIIYTA